MDDPLLPVNTSRDQFNQQITAAFGGPAFLRRGRRISESWDLLLDRCRNQRKEWLAGIRIHLALLQALAGDWVNLVPLLQDFRELAKIQILHQELQPQLRYPQEATRSNRILRRALLDLVESLERFNRKWTTYLGQVDLGPVNQARDEYNRFYVLEKECALGSARLARHGFVPLAPLTPLELWEQFPLLPVPILPGFPR